MFEIYAYGNVDTLTGVFNAIAAIMGGDDYFGLIKTVAVTAGYISPEPRAEFYRHLDAANVDLKGFTEGFYKHTVPNSARCSTPSSAWRQPMSGSS